tara:strand:- start:6331 stop:6927 length:597 start_codon:yes stop_codon:yes gene_type:complete
MNTIKPAIDDEPIKDNIEGQYFKIVSFLFLFIFIFYAFKNGFQNGFKLSIFIWCLTVCTTPISSASVLLSFPIKIFTQIPMFVTKFITSLLSLILLGYFYIYNYDLICKIPLGKAFIKIIKSKLYSLFLVSIIASVISSYMLDNFVDYFILSEKTMLKKDTLGKLLFLFLIFICLNFIYFNMLIKNKIVEFGKKYYFL